MGTQATYCTVVFCLRPRSRRKHDLRTQTAGACRYVWNRTLAEVERQTGRHCRRKRTFSWTGRKRRWRSRGPDETGPALVFLTGKGIHEIAAPYGMAFGRAVRSRRIHTRAAGVRLAKVFRGKGGRPSFRVRDPGLAKGISATPDDRRAVARGQSCNMTCVKML